MNRDRDIILRDLMNYAETKRQVERQREANETSDSCHISVSKNAGKIDFDICGNAGEICYLLHELTKNTIKMFKERGDIAGILTAEVSVMMAIEGLGKEIMKDDEEKGGA